MRGESLVAGIGGLFYWHALGFIPLVNQIWIHVGILTSIIIAGVVFVLLTAEIKVGLEILIEKLND